jgi:hypothetical protein
VCSRAQEHLRQTGLPGTYAMCARHLAVVSSHVLCCYAGHQLLPVWVQDVPVVLEPAHGDSQQRGAAGTLPQLPHRGVQNTMYTHLVASI